MWGFRLRISIFRAAKARGMSRVTLAPAKTQSPIHPHLRRAPNDADHDICGTIVRYGSSSTAIFSFFL